MQRSAGLQDYFLNQLRREHQLVTIFLVNGFQIKGMVCGFDDFTMMVETEGRQQLIYKHAVSTLIPSRPVTMEPPSGAQSAAK